MLGTNENLGRVRPNQAYVSEPQCHVGTALRMRGVGVALHKLPPKGVNRRMQLGRPPNALWALSARLRVSAENLP